MSGRDVPVLLVVHRRPEKTRRVLEAIAKARPRRLFVAAMRPLLRRSWYVPHARSRSPYFGAAPNLLLGALLRAGRGARDLAVGELRLRQGPWPRWAEVAGSAATDAAWRRYPLEDSALRDLFLPELEPAAIRASLRALHPLGQMMALQLAMLTGDER